jgi:hypothetical protein
MKCEVSSYVLSREGTNITEKCRPCYYLEQCSSTRFCILIDKASRGNDRFCNACMPMKTRRMNHYHLLPRLSLRLLTVLPCRERAVKSTGVCLVFPFERSLNDERNTNNTTTPTRGRTTPFLRCSIVYYSGGQVLVCSIGYSPITAFPSKLLRVLLRDRREAPVRYNKPRGA